MKTTSKHPVLPLWKIKINLVSVKGMVMYLICRSWQLYVWSFWVHQSFMLFWGGGMGWIIILKQTKLGLFLKVLRIMKFIASVSLNFAILATICLIIPQSSLIFQLPAQFLLLWFCARKLWIFIRPLIYTLTRYARALGAFYMRLVGTPLECYKYLEPLYNDYRKLKRKSTDGGR